MSMSTSASPPPPKKQSSSSTLISGCSLILVLFHCLRKRKQRTTPSSDSDSNPPHPFSYDLLRRATNSFSTLLGHGGFGSVFSGTLPSTGKPVAVKLMDSVSTSLGNHQGEREFHNELFFASKLRSNLLVPAIGFSSDPKRLRFVLVYELMENGNLHDALLRRKCPELTLWNTRFSIILDIAKGIQYLHSCDPPIIHGDIKPSNVLLDRSFSAKIADFGLARLKLKTLSPVETQLESNHKRKEDLESDGGETDSVNTIGFEGESEIVGGKEVSVKKNGSVKDYVMDWIGKEVSVSEERPKGVSTVDVASCSGRRTEKSKSKKKDKWWESMDEEKGGLKKEKKRRPAREWWKEEYSQELEKKKKKKKKKERKNVKKGGAKSNNDWWWDLEKDDDVKKSCGDSLWLSGEIQKSGAISISSTSPSMRGTVFYVAPECGGDSSEVLLSDKCDVYSFGVLLLVIVSGRRPLQVTEESPMLEFKPANLVSWARHCARNGKNLIQLVDQSIQSLDTEQALLCIKIALLCLLKLPARRPSMNEVVGMLSGELEPPQLPPQYSSQSQFSFKNQELTNPSQQH